MNQQAFNLLGAFIAIGAIAGIWFYFAEDDSFAEPEEHRAPHRPTETQRRSTSEHSTFGTSPSALQRYRVDYTTLSRWFEKQPEIVVTARPDPAISAVGKRQDALLAAILGNGRDASASASEEQLNHLKGIVLNPGGAATVGWRPIVGNNPPVHPVTLAQEISGLRPQESMADEFNRLIRFASPSTLETTVSDLNGRVERWRKFHADNPSNNPGRNTHSALSECNGIDEPTAALLSQP